MTFILWLVIGGILGWLASMVMGTNDKQGMVLNVVVGIVGAFLGGLLLAPLFGTGTIKSERFQHRVAARLVPGRGHPAGDRQLLPSSPRHNPHLEAVAQRLHGSESCQAAAGCSGREWLTLAAAVFALNFTNREKRVAKRIPRLYSASDPDILRAMGVLLGPAIFEGNRFEVLLNGRLRIGGKLWDHAASLLGSQM